jgi:predicted ABC-class ATPase
MASDKDLKSILQRIDGKGYKAYHDIKGTYRFPDYTLIIDHVQGDPFASPSKIRLQIEQSHAGFAEELFANKPRRIALQDFLARSFSRSIKQIARLNRGIGKSGLIAVDSGAQEVLERTSIHVNAKQVEARFFLGLPARGRIILGREAGEMFFNELPRIVKDSLFFTSLPQKELLDHIQVVEDYAEIPRQLKEKGLVAFIADGSTLPRRSGVDDRALVEGGEVKKVVTFISPEKLKVELWLPNRGRTVGMGIPQGVNLIVGGGFHGKSTLLNSIGMGVYPHISGDGREYVAADPTAVKIRAEDGRRVEKVNIIPFINNLPFRKDTIRFSTDNASGSTSQAANIIEALEAGSRLLLVDEDTSATNFMIRDARMQELVVKEKEPITPFIDKVRPLFTDYGVSTILVAGGSGEYFEVADTIIMMDEFVPHDVSTEAREIAEKYRTARNTDRDSNFGMLTPRSPAPASFNPSRGKREVKIDARGLKQILFGKTPIDLSAIEQLVDPAQTRAIGELIHYYSQKYAGREKNLTEGLTKLMDELEKEGLDLVSPFKPADLAMPRLFELAAAINRMRTLKIQ